MENPSKAYSGAMQIPGIEVGLPLPEDWRLARAAHVDLLLMGMPRVNLLLIASDGVIRYVLETLLLDLHEPVTHWSPGERLALPSIGSAGTLILHEVSALGLDEQLFLLDWLERDGGRSQVVSTTATPLMMRVQTGAFLDTLYYRLNTVCVNVAA